ncbi:MAG TPA: hypothetical protein VFS43_03735 [Polyangiaceae bacterium]|nr:hypothetical protein [Polyangiaceae bacterium]
MRSRNKRPSSSTVIALASPLLGALALGCAPEAAPAPSVEGAGLGAAEVVAASADAACAPMKFYDASFRVTTARHYEDIDMYNPDGPSCDIIAWDETANERYHLFWKDTAYFLAPLGHEETQAIRLNAATTATQLNFSAELSNYDGYEVFTICPEYTGYPYSDFYNTLTGTIEGHVDRATGEITFTRQCRVEDHYSCDGFEFKLDVASQGAHACEPSNADPLPVACAPLASGDLDAARFHVIGVRNTMDDVPDVPCTVANNFIDYDATFTLRQEGGQYFANLFQLGQHNVIPLTKSSETATEVVLTAGEGGQDGNYELLNICPEYYGYLVFGPWLSGGLELRVNLATGAVKEKRTCMLEYFGCGSDHTFYETGEGAYVCPP